MTSFMPRDRMLSRFNPRTMKVTASPASASFAPTYPPMAPAPITVIFIEPRVKAYGNLRRAWHLVRSVNHTAKIGNREPPWNAPVHLRALRKVTILQRDRAARTIIDHLKIIETRERHDTELAERLLWQQTRERTAHVERN